MDNRKTGARHLVGAGWLEEVAYFCPVPIIVCGTKLDLADDPSTLEKLRAKRLSPVTLEQAISKTRGNVVKVMECSALTQKNLKYLFDEAIRAVLSDPNRGKPGKSGSDKAKCIVM